jgi:hypothetical protein
MATVAISTTVPFGGPGTYVAELRSRVTPA